MGLGGSWMPIMACKTAGVELKQAPGDEMLQLACFEHRSPSLCKACKMGKMSTLCRAPCDTREQCSTVSGDNRAVPLCDSPTIHPLPNPLSTQPSGSAFLPDCSRVMPGSLASSVDQISSCSTFDTGLWGSNEVQFPSDSSNTTPRDSPSDACTNPSISPLHGYITSGNKANENKSSCLSRAVDASGNAPRVRSHFPRRSRARRRLRGKRFSHCKTAVCSPEGNSSRREQQDSGRVDGQSANCGITLLEMPLGEAPSRINSFSENRQKDMNSISTAGGFMDSAEDSNTIVSSQSTAMPKRGRRETREQLVPENTPQNTLNHVSIALRDIQVLTSANIERTITVLNVDTPSQCMHRMSFLYNYPTSV